MCLSQEKKPDEGDCFCAPMQCDTPEDWEWVGPTWVPRSLSSQSRGGWRASQGTNRAPCHAEKGPAEAGTNTGIAVSSLTACDQDPGLH